GRLALFGAGRFAGGRPLRARRATARGVAFAGGGVALARRTPRLDPARLALDHLAVAIGLLLAAVAMDRVPRRTDPDRGRDQHRRIAAQDTAHRTRTGFRRAQRHARLQPFAGAVGQGVADAVADLADQVHHFS